MNQNNYPNIPVKTSQGGKLKIPEKKHETGTVQHIHALILRNATSKVLMRIIITLNKIVKTDCVFRG